MLASYSTLDPEAVWGWVIAVAERPTGMKVNPTLDSLWSFFYVEASRFSLKTV